MVVPTASAFRTHHMLPKPNLRACHSSIRRATQASRSSGNIGRNQIEIQQQLLLAHTNTYNVASRKIVGYRAGHHNRPALSTSVIQ